MQNDNNLSIIIIIIASTTTAMITRTLIMTYHEQTQEPMAKSTADDHELNTLQSKQFISSFKSRIDDDAIKKVASKLQSW